MAKREQSRGHAGLIDSCGSGARREDLVDVPSAVVENRTIGRDQDVDGPFEHSRASANDGFAVAPRIPGKSQPRRDVSVSLEWRRFTINIDPEPIVEGQVVPDLPRILSERTKVMSPSAPLRIVESLVKEAWESEMKRLRSSQVRR